MEKTRSELEAVSPLSFISGQRFNSRSKVHTWQLYLHGGRRARGGGVTAVGVV